MKVEDNISLKLSLRARLRVSRSLVQVQTRTHRGGIQLTKLYNRSSHIKRIISKVMVSKAKLGKTHNKTRYQDMVKTRSRSRKDFEYHPFRHLVSRNVDPKAFKRFLIEAHEGAVYSAKHLQPIQFNLESKKAANIQDMGGKKFLILDLDETLIHSVTEKEACEVTIPDHSGASIRMNVRPYVREFLENMSKHYSIYVFTASTQSYAQPILNHLDPNSTIFKGLLCRPSCVLTSQGCYVKDLRIFQDKLQSVVIIDNYIHSFGLQMQNGIPILPFQNNTRDQQLKYVESLLLRVKDTSDVRPFLTHALQLRKLGEMKRRELNL